MQTVARLPTFSGRAATATDPRLFQLELTRRSTKSHLLPTKTVCSFRPGKDCAKKKHVRGTRIAQGGASSAAVRHSRDSTCMSFIHLSTALNDASSVMSYTSKMPCSSTANTSSQRERSGSVSRDRRASTCKCHNSQHHTSPLTLRCDTSSRSSASVPVHTSLLSHTNQPVAIAQCVCVCVCVVSIRERPESTTSSTC